MLDERDYPALFGTTQADRAPIGPTCAIRVPSPLGRRVTAGGALRGSGAAAPSGALRAIDSSSPRSCRTFGRAAFHAGRLATQEWWGTLRRVSASGPRASPWVQKSRRHAVA